ncbi:YkyA family protein [Bacillus weihaiensis]|uniref:YkyA family protein n=1 Tax=Bacillus weihaiensis TaxID=1547283 RepID=UPI002355A313|nr:YkyA family protein [Bacillus weihaiensis]
MKKLMNVSVLTTLLLVILVGCLGPSPEEKIYQKLEKVVSLEKSFQEQQEPLLALEKEENELFNQIMDLGMKEFDQVVSLSNQALEMIDEREEKMQVENESILASKEEFKGITLEMEKIEDEDTLEILENLQTTMENRYESYETLYNHYSTSIKLDKELYEMLQNEELTMEELEEQISKINDSYEKVMNENEIFNGYTEEYNQLKIDFYQKAGLNVKEAE